MKKPVYKVLLQELRDAYNLASCVIYPMPVLEATRAQCILDVLSKSEVPEEYLEEIFRELKVIRSFHDDPKQTGISKIMDKTIADFENQVTPEVLKKFQFWNQEKEMKEFRKNGGIGCTVGCLFAVSN